MIEQKELKDLWISVINNLNPENIEIKKTLYFKKGYWRIAVEHLKKFRSIVLAWGGPSGTPPVPLEGWIIVPPSEKRKGWDYRVKLSPADLMGFLTQLDAIATLDIPRPDAYKEIVEFLVSEGEKIERTEREAIIKSRLGQGPYREKIKKLWGCCSVTGVKNTDLLRASHAKPWSNCQNEERLDEYNGLLLIPNLDHLFDRGLITFDENGCVRISKNLSKEDRRILQIDDSLKLRNKFPKNEKYLEYHRKFVFRDAGAN